MPSACLCIYRAPATRTRPLKIDKLSNTQNPRTLSTGELRVLMPSPCLRVRLQHAQHNPTSRPAPPATRQPLLLPPATAPQEKHFCSEVLLRHLPFPLFFVSPHPMSESCLARALRVTPVGSWHKELSRTQWILQYSWHNELSPTSYRMYLAQTCWIASCLHTARTAC